MTKSVQLPYFPANIPNNPAELPTWLYDELYRIATAINAAPEGFAVEQSLSINISATGVETQLFLDTDAEYDIPGGGWNPSAGSWTAQASGTYQLNYQAWVEKHPQPGNRQYGISLLVYVNGTERYRVSDSANEAYDSTSTAALSAIILSGDVVTFSILATSDTGDFVIPCNAAASIVRVN